MATSDHIYVIDPRDYGCPWNGADDDLPGFQAMLATIDKNNSATVIQIPAGLGYFSDDIHISRSIEVVGTGGGKYNIATNGTSGIRLAPGKSIYLDGPLFSIDGGDSGSSRFKNLTIVSTQTVQATPAATDLTPGNPYNPWPLYQWYPYFMWDSRQSGGVRYVKGNCVIKAWTGSSPGLPTNKACFFRCVAGGIPMAGTPEPDGFSTTIPGTTIVDTGGVVWVSEAFPQDWLRLKPMSLVIAYGCQAIRVTISNA